MEEKHARDTFFLYDDKEPGKKARIFLWVAERSEQQKKALPFKNE